LTGVFPFVVLGFRRPMVYYLDIASIVCKSVEYGEVASIDVP